MKTTLKNRADIINSIVTQIRRIATTRPAGNRQLVFLPAVWGRTLVYNPAKTRPVIHLTPRPGDLIIQLPAASEATPDATAIKRSLTHPRYVRAIGIVDGDQAISVCRRAQWQTCLSSAIVDDRGGVWLVNDRNPRKIALLRHILPGSCQLRADFDTVAGDRTAPADAPSWLDHWDGTSTGGCVHSHGTHMARALDASAYTLWRVAIVGGVTGLTLSAASGVLYRAWRGAIPVRGRRLEACGYRARAVHDACTISQLEAVMDMLSSRDGIAWIRASLNH